MAHFPGLIKRASPSPPVFPGLEIGLGRVTLLRRQLPCENDRAVEHGSAREWMALARCQRAAGASLSSHLPPQPFIELERHQSSLANSRDDRHNGVVQGELQCGIVFVWARNVMRRF